MNNSQSSDAMRRKRPAARRASQRSDSEPPPAIEGESASRSLDAAPASANENAHPAKRVTARRAPTPPHAAPESPAPQAANDSQAATSAHRESPPGARADRPSEPPRGRGLTRAHIDHHVREAARLATRLESADTQPPEHGSFLRRLARLRFVQHSDQVDDFGLDSAYEASIRPLFDRMCNDYFRTQVDGMHYVPTHGRALLVGNHSGALPWDGIMLRTALRLHHASRRELRWLVEDHVFHAPFLGTFVNRIGAVRACQENAERLLQRESLLAVFPEGIKGIAKPYAERYKLQRFGRGGYVRLALRTGAPVIPVAIVGAEEANPLLYKVNAFAKSVGLPFIPVTPTFPWLGPLGIAPLPSRWRIAFGAPIREIARHDADAANDDVLVHELNECVRASVRALLDDALRRRGENVYV